MRVFTEEDEYEDCSTDCFAGDAVPVEGDLMAYCDDHMQWWLPHAGQWFPVDVPPPRFVRALSAETQ